MLVRLLIYIIVAVLIYRIVKSWIRRGIGDRQERMSNSSPERVDDVMIKDPFCGVYFPQRKGIVLSVEGDDLYFCSNACRDGYLTGQSQNR